MNFLNFISNVLDPQYKLEYLNFSLTTIYGDLIGGSLFTNVKDALYELYNDYVNDCKSQNETESTAPNIALSNIGGSQTSSGDVHASVKSTSVLKARFKQQKLESGTGGSIKNELDIYLSESSVDMEKERKFDLLKWWRLNAKRFPVLSRMA